MGDSLGDVAKSWLADPPWQRVFKHTFDVIEDYVTYMLIAVGGISLSVRLLTTLATGDLVCIIIGVMANNSSPGTLDPYPAGSAIGFINYASTDETCIRKVFTPFMEHMPFILILQTLVLVIVEKFTFKIPRIAQKVERFYQNIVEQSLFGKDPDVAEDMIDPMTSTDAISRKRQRNEICVTLKRSSIIHDVYIGKNCVEVLMALIYLSIDISFYVTDQPDDHVACDLPVKNFPGVVHDDGIIRFQCHGKKTSFFKIALLSQIVLLSLHGLLSLGAITWCLFFRSVTSLLGTIESMKRDRVTVVSVLGGKEGKDFLFLFDLLAHTCGLESTLRVLTHSDEKFYEICKPNLELKDHITLEEDKLKIVWGPADIERWLQIGKRSSSAQRSIEIDSYEVTIFPAETVKNTQTLPALSKLNKTMKSAANLDEPTYHTWFYDLHGGRTEYVITIACMIGKSRMKGEKVVTNLVPYGPEKPRSGMVKMAGTNQVEIFWDPPKGDFTKYYLYIDRLSDKDVPRPESILRLNSARSSKSQDSVGDQLDGGPTSNEHARPNIRVMENISSKLTTYTILGLEPGESYKIELGTKTGNVSTRQSITDLILTRPLAPKSVRVEDVTSNSCVLAWAILSGHSSLRGFQIHVKTGDGRMVKDVAVTRMSKSFVIQGLGPGIDYDIALTSLCVADDGKRTESDAATISTTTLPEKIRNLRLDNSTPNSLTIKWDAPVVSSNYKYKVTISGKTGEQEEDDNDEQDSLEWRIEPTDPTVEAIEAAKPKMAEFVSTIEVSGDKTQYTLSKLPEIFGTGYAYSIEVSVVVTTLRENEVISKPVSGIFVTRPLAPTNLRLDKDRARCITWHKSMTPYVQRYKIRWKPLEENVTGDVDVVEAFVGASAAQDGPDSIISFVFPPTLAVGAAYKVNVYAVVDVAGQSVESKELHEKLFLKSEDELVVYIEEPKDV